MALLELKDVSYSYSNNTEKKNVLNNVNVNFEQGKFYAIIGKSGSGKSTLLSLMAGLDIPKAGQVSYEGSSTNDMDLDKYRRQCAAVVYQDFGLFPLLTALENIMYPMELCHVSKKQAMEDAKQLTGLVSLPDKLHDRFPQKMSGGEQQRVAIARALAMNRKLILADEPTGSLDSENSAMIIDLLTKLAHEEGKCVIVVTHDIFVMKKADVIYHIVDGRLSEYNEL